MTRWIAEMLYPFTIMDEPGFRKIFEIANEKIALTRQPSWNQICMKKQKTNSNPFCLSST
jgi:hypothetical protein